MLAKDNFVVFRWNSTASNKFVFVCVCVCFRTVCWKAPPQQTRQKQRVAEHGWRGWTVAFGLRVCLRRMPLKPLPLIKQHNEWYLPFMVQHSKNCSEGMATWCLQWSSGSRVQHIVSVHVAQTHNIKSFEPAASKETQAHDYQLRLLQLSRALLGNGAHTDSKSRDCQLQTIMMNQFKTRQ